mmetsp:Transcript_36568/g.85486  ORF Transcript_36568/g.85486 Transcript_36568/m.85486 type:complete len:106 (+) Transcript_36568:2929-3246(+)
MDEVSVTSLTSLTFLSCACTLSNRTSTAGAILDFLIWEEGHSADEAEEAESELRRFSYPATMSRTLDVPPVFIISKCKFLNYLSQNVYLNDQKRNEREQQQKQMK